MTWCEIERRPVGGRLAQLGGALVIHYDVDQDTTVRRYKVIGHGVSVECASTPYHQFDRVQPARDDELFQNLGHLRAGAGAGG